MTNVFSWHALMRALVSCTVAVALPGEFATRAMIPVSGHPVTYLVTRLSHYQSLALGFDIDLEHTLTAYCMSGVVQPGHCASVQTFLHQTQSASTLSHLGPCSQSLDSWRDQ